MRLALKGGGKIRKKPSPTLAKKIIRECYYRDLVLTAPIGFYDNVVRICPPLVITQRNLMLS